MPGISPTSPTLFAALPRTALEFRGRGDSDYDPQPMRYNPLTYART